LHTDAITIVRIGAPAKLMRANERLSSKKNDLLHQQNVEILR